MAERSAWLSIGVNVTWTLLNLLIAVASGSLAVAAEMVQDPGGANVEAQMPTANSRRESLADLETAR